MNETETIKKVFELKDILEKIGNKQIFHEFDITVSLYTPLKRISEGVITIASIKQCSNESSANLTQKMQKLENKGLISRKISSEDKRKFEFGLTAKGKKVLQKVDKKFTQVSAGIFATLSHQEKQGFDKILSNLLDNIKNNNLTK